MRTLTEISAFCALAVLAHLAFVAPPSDAGAESAGDGGEDLLQMMVSNASTKALVEIWDKPPEIDVALAETPMTPPSPTSFETPQQTMPQRMPAPSQPMPSPVPSMAMPVTSLDAPPLPIASPSAPPKPTPVSKPAEVKPVDKPEAEPSPPAKPKPKAQSEASIRVEARKAAGDGGKTAKGNKGKAETASLSKSQKTSLLEKWSRQVRARVARRAPKGVGKGRAVVRIKVSSTGQLLHADLVQSSGNQKVDRHVLVAVKKASPYPRPPKGLKVSSAFFDVPIKSR
ncbi:TonB family protein [Shimia thalassica]|uniref:energy transducer TonB family protein n=1 Tax=Shimia thalassica TaxID=1715693 RepID=UPI0027334F3C|nr:energy transducer TonB [Shimia thalassica]MDP2582392.1 TonB family protein [Shimia thalassica]